MKTSPSYIVLDRHELPHDGDTFEFEGTLHQDTQVSFIWVDIAPGGRVRLHKHPYREIFIVVEGVAAFTVGSEALDRHAGQVIIVAAETPHSFTNSGDTALKQIDIHVSKHFITDWLEDQDQ